MFIWHELQHNTNPHQTASSPSPRTLPMDSRFLMIITSWSLAWSSLLMPRLATKRMKKYFIIYSTYFFGNWIQASDKNTNNAWRTCDFDGWAVVGSLRSVLNVWSEFIIRSKQTPVEGANDIHLYINRHDNHTAIHSTKTNMLHVVIFSKMIFLLSIIFLFSSTKL